jgi:hypothetical protein
MIVRAALIAFVPICASIDQITDQAEQPEGNDHDHTDDEWQIQGQSDYTELVLCRDDVTHSRDCRIASFGRLDQCYRSATTAFARAAAG